MSRKLSFLPLSALLFAGTPALAEAPRVAVDIAPVHSLVARVMEGVGTPDLVLSPGASPHEYSLRPSEAKILEDAGIVFWTSPDLTPWLADAIGTLADDANVVQLVKVKGTILLPFREDALFEAHKHGGSDHGDSHDHGHDHDDHGHDDHGHDDHGHDDHGHDHEHGHAHGKGGIDPHAWLSVENGVIWLDAIAWALADVDPANGPTYAANAAVAIRELETLQAEVNTILEPVRGRNFIVFHDAYQYFEREFGFPASGAITISDATDPSPARIAEVQARVSELGVSCVLSEPQFDPGLVATVLEGSGARTGVVDPLGSGLETGPGLYPAMLRNLATALAECL